MFFLFSEKTFLTCLSKGRIFSFKWGSNIFLMFGSWNFSLTKYAFRLIVNFVHFIVLTFSLGTTKEALTIFKLVVGVERRCWYSPTCFLRIQIVATMMEFNILQFEGSRLLAWYVNTYIVWRMKNRRMKDVTFVKYWEQNLFVIKTPVRFFAMLSPREKMFFFKNYIYHCYCFGWSYYLYCWI